MQATHDEAILAKLMDTLDEAQKRWLAVKPCDLDMKGSGRADMHHVGGGPRNLVKPS